MDLFAEIYDLVLDALGSMQSENILPKNIDFKNVTVELPRDSLHGDMSTNAAMVLVKQANLKPREIAEIQVCTPKYKCVRFAYSMYVCNMYPLEFFTVVYANRP